MADIKHCGGEFLFLKTKLIPNKHLASTHWVYSQEIERKK
jgi:hypothetical protein